MDDFTAKRFADLAAQSERACRFTFSDFLTEAEYGTYLQMQQQLSFSCVTVWGGREDADRVMLRFGNPETLGYEEDFPIACLKISPAQEKFAEALTHRDILGALMHLGMERSTLGDILFDGKTAYLLCKSDMADYICRELSRVRHTTVICTVTDAFPAALASRTKPLSVQIPSERLDALIAKVCHISRGDCLTLFRAKKVFLNGACTENSSHSLRSGDRISVRGYGKFRYTGITGTTKKGNLIAGIEMFV